MDLKKIEDVKKMLWASVQTNTFKHLGVPLRVGLSATSPRSIKLLVIKEPTARSGLSAPIPHAKAKQKEEEK